MRSLEGMGRVMRTVLAVAGVVVVAAAAVFVVRHDWAVENLMKQIHGGKASPWSMVRAQAAAESPLWGEIRGPAEGIVRMARTLVDAKNADIRAAADGYVAAASDLIDSVHREDGPGFRAAVRGLERSCADCHSVGGVGGRLALD